MNPPPVEQNTFWSITFPSPVKAVRFMPLG